MVLMGPFAEVNLQQQCLIYMLSDIAVFSLIVAKTNYWVPSLHQIKGFDAYLNSNRA